MQAMSFFGQSLGMALGNSGGGKKGSRKIGKRAQSDESTTSSEESDSN